MRLPSRPFRLKVTSASLCQPTRISSRLAKEDRKLLLRLVDMEDNLRGLATLHSFTCGYRLACGIHRELAEEAMYSFAKEEEERACRKAQAHDESNSEETNV